MDYIAVNNSSVYENTQSIVVLKVDDTDELIDINNVEYIQNINLINTSYSGSYGPITEQEAAEVNDMLQYWGAIHMFGKEEILNKTDIKYTNVRVDDYNIALISQPDITDALFGLGNYDEESYTEEQLHEIESIYNNILGE